MPGKLQNATQAAYVAYMSMNGEMSKEEAQERWAYNAEHYPPEWMRSWCDVALAVIDAYAEEKV